MSTGAGLRPICPIPQPKPYLGLARLSGPLLDSVLPPHGLEAGLASLPARSEAVSESSSVETPLEQLSRQTGGLGHRLGRASTGSGGTDDEPGTGNRAAQPVSSRASSASVSRQASGVGAGARGDSGKVIAVLLELGERGVAALLPAFLAVAVDQAVPAEPQPSQQRQAGDQPGLDADHFSDATRSWKALILARRSSSRALAATSASGVWAWV